MLTIRQVPVLNDNYAYLLHETESGATAVVDPGEAAPVLAAAESEGWTIDTILLTHHHPDHIGGAQDIQAETGSRIVASASDLHRIPDVTLAVSDSDTVTLGETHAVVFEIPGHTSGLVTYWFPTDDALFTGDALFSLGCGRMFEGTAQQMWTGMTRLRALPDETRIFCGHEYTLQNGIFARSLDPDNPLLEKRLAEAEGLRRRGKSTLPALMGEEKVTNPFLRADTTDMAAAVGMEGADPAAIFAELRRRKDIF